MHTLYLFALCLLGGSYGVEQILTFEPIAIGTTWVLLEWTVDQVDPNLLMYRIITDNYRNNDVPCDELVCHENVTDLTSCALHDFGNLIWYNGPIGGETYFTSATTLDVVPNPPRNGNVVLGASSALITWGAPIEDQCIVEYEVCFSATIEDVNTKSCYISSTTSIEADNYYFCTDYSVEIVSLTESHLTSSPYTFTVDAVDGVPGEVVDLHIDNITSDTAILSWDLPEENRTCSDNYDVNWKEDKASKSASDIGIIDSITITGEVWVAVYPLKPCTNYIFTVWAISPEDQRGPPSYTYGRTEEIAPSKPTNITITPVGTSSLEITWTSDGDICLDHYTICYSSLVPPYYQVCINIDDPSIIISELLPCSYYQVVIFGVSPDGNSGEEIIFTARTEDEAPGTPTNLFVVDTTAHTITISFEAPIINPQCVAQYSISYIDPVDYITGNTNDGSIMGFKPTGIELESAFTNHQTNLDACTTYIIEVIAVSHFGLRSLPASTTAETLIDIPSAPVNLRCTEIGTNYIDISWNKPLLNSKCLSYFSIFYESNQGTIDKGIAVAEPFGVYYIYVIDNLASNSWYEIAVVPRIADSTAGAAATINCTTLA